MSHTKHTPGPWHTKPLDKLKHHVTGAIERGEKTAIESIPDLRPYIWHENNTEFTEWFERDRAMVRLTDKRGNEIICLWDDAVAEFESDGFKGRTQDWHEALAEYATTHKLRATYDTP